MLPMFLSHQILYIDTTAYSLISDIDVFVCINCLINITYTAATTLYVSQHPNESDAFD